MYKGLCFKSGEKENHQEEAGRKQEGVSDESRAAVTAHHKAGVNESLDTRGLVPHSSCGLS